MHREYMTTWGSHLYVKATENLNTNSIFSQGWEIVHTT